MVIACIQRESGFKPDIFEALVIQLNDLDLIENKHMNFKGELLGKVEIFFEENHIENESLSNLSEILFQGKSMEGRY